MDNQAIEGITAIWSLIFSTLKTVKITVIDMTNAPLPLSQLGAVISVLSIDISLEL